MKRKHIVLFVLPFLLMLFSCSLPKDDDTTTKEPEPKSGFIGAETCKECHEKQYTSYAKSIHSKKSAKGPAAQDACETCHGPGAKHVEKGGGRGVNIFTYNKDVDPRKRSAKCMTCHEETRQLTNWNLSKHKNEDIACNDCHSPHDKTEKLLKDQQPTLCFECHKDIRSQTSRQSHHPIREGLIKCSSCHDPHGTFADNQLKADTVNELCYKCHSEKRGPFMIEHPPVDENCLNCHTPHGSNHNKLLIKNPPQLCQGCHDNSGHRGTAFTASTMVSGSRDFHGFGKACLNCHSNIHGSNANANRSLRK